MNHLYDNMFGATLIVSQPVILVMMLAFLNLRGDLLRHSINLEKCFWIFLFFCMAQCLFSLSAQQFIISTTIGWIAVRFATDIHGPQWMNCDEFGELLTVLSSTTNSLTWSGF